MSHDPERFFSPAGDDLCEALRVYGAGIPEKCYMVFFL